ncbi:MAG: sulfatase-like hydrolase/transferase [Clostridia bacterium]|nr:sulfatase-like hydrolase/transferase [Clostridia bacterium]
MDANTNTSTGFRAFLKKYGFALFFPVSILYLELTFNLFVYITSWGNVTILRTLLYILFSSIIFGGVFYILSNLSKNEKVNYAVAIVLSALTFLLFGTQIVYFSFFQRPLPFNSVEGAGQAAEFYSMVFVMILNRLYALIVFLIPLLFLIIFGRKFFNFKRSKLKFKGIVVATCVVAYLAMVVAVQFTSGEANGPHTYYHNVYDVEPTQRIFGVMTNFRLDIQRTIFGFEEQLGDDSYVELPTDDNTTGTTSKPITSPTPNNYNVMDIDFDSLMANETDPELLSMHGYFSAAKGTQKNKYTGMFKDKNLIVLCCESFSNLAIDKELTPTLYRLATEGFEFTNFYVPLWWTSTTDGEYVPSMSLMPKTGVWSHKESADNYLPFCLGNQFNSIGYDVYAYHNHDYRYYDRQMTYPAMGYDKYKGNGGGYENGLDMELSWPESDLEMIMETVDEYVNDDKFHTYYMTVSGHATYTFSSNEIASKNKEYVADLKLSESAKAYLACNLELEFAMNYLLSSLEKAGKLEDTVIVMYADHYPYALGKETIDELAGKEVDTAFEIYKSSLIIWSYGMEHTVVDTPCSTLDILPTLSNLFGMQYDSRLLMGRDIFSPDSNIVMLSNRSWITDIARYDAATGEVTSFTGAEISDEYVDTVNSIVKQRFVYSVKILENDYWGVVFGKVIKTEQQE